MIMAIKRTEHEKEKEILRKKIISVLPTKDGYKKLQAKSRQEQLSIHKKFLKEFMGTAKMFLTDGENIDPQKIILEPREVKRRSFEEKLSRWWNLIWWSIPYQHPYGRQMRFLLWDTGRCE
jgi:hypothetical protein